MMDDVDWENSQSIHQSVLWQNYQQSHLVANQENLRKRTDEFLPMKYFFHTLTVLLHAIKLYDMGP
jgi:hypothetical protein